jgi:hypothetical protein
MVLHALWDFGFLGTVATVGKSRPAVGLLANGTFLLGSSLCGSSSPEAFTGGATRPIS